MENGHKKVEKNQKGRLEGEVGKQHTLLFNKACKNVPS